MKKKSFRKILSALCAMTTMTICFSKVQAAPLENTNSIDQSKSYIIYSGDTNKTLYDDGGNNEGWLRQGKFLDFDKNFKWKLEKNGNNFYLKNEGTTWYVKGESKEVVKNSVTTSYVVSDKANNGNDKGAYSFEKVEDGYKLKSVSNNKYLKHGVSDNYVTFTNNASDASVWKIEEAPTVDSSKNYIIYSTNTNNTIFDDGGNTDGWVRKDAYAKFQKKFTWSFEEGNTGLYIKNLLTKSYLKETHGTVNGKTINYALTEKTNGVAKGEYTFERIFNTGGSYKIKCNNTGKYLLQGQQNAGNYITFADSSATASVWKIQEEEAYPKPAGSITLWDNAIYKNYYRIPAIGTANDGTLLAINDLRYNNAADLGNHRIDLLIKNSTDNGVTWSNETNLTVKNSSANYGFGDAAIVADRNSDKVIILAAAGDKGFWHSNRAYVSTRQNPIKVAKLVSNDGGKTFSEPEYVTDEIYGLDTSWTRLFVASGRIMQSRYVKVGDYYRIYAAILVGKGNSNAGNYIIYSDDFGDTWKLLGNATSPVPAGDEAKIEELPNGNVVITSRTGTGRLINVFTYDKNDTTFSKGQWEASPKKLTLGNGSACNGETYIVYAKDTTTNEYKYLVLQSLPTVGNSRKGVGIYFKEINSSDSTVNDFITGWNSNNFYMVQPRDSAYSTMAIQKDGKIAFLYEDRNSGGYDTQFISLDLKTVTNGKYEMAFTGIGSEKNPYVVETEEQAKAVNEVFKNEKVNWTYKVSPEVPGEVTAAATTANSAVITWNKANDNGVTVGYNIYNEKGERLNSDIITEERFELENLEPGKEYSITVKAVNKEGAESEAANFIFSTKSESELVNPIEDGKKEVEPVEDEKQLAGEYSGNQVQPGETVKVDDKETNAKDKNLSLSLKGLANTGDITNVSMLIGGALLSAGGLAGLLARKRKKR